MRSREDNSSVEEQQKDDFFTLRLFIAGVSPVSARAVKNVRAICEEFLHGRFDLEIVDAHQQPLMVRDDDVTALPMLIKKTPAPRRKLLGDCSDREKVLKGLGIKN